MGVAGEHEVLRRLARDQWVRLHGTPRVTVLVGGEQARRVWSAWLALSDVRGMLFDGEDVDLSIRRAVERALAVVEEPVAVLAPSTQLTAWRQGRMDRLAALVDEGWLEIRDTVTNETRVDVLTSPDRDGSTANPPSTSRDELANQSATHGTRGRSTLATPYHLDARSAAEAALFEALESTAATRGRFVLNESLSIHFGSRAAEIDLLSRTDRIAIEIDGIHHFADPDCYRRDRRKDLLLQGHGLLVIRLLAEDVMRDPREAVKIVCQGLAFREAT